MLLLQNNQQQLRAVVLLLSIATTSVLFAAGADTNINATTDLFDAEIENKAKLDALLSASKAQADKDIVNKEALTVLNIGEAVAEAKTVELDLINVHSLESAGHEMSCKPEHEYYHTLEVDYTSPLVQEHKKDMDLIADASEKLMSKLVDGLKALDIDCETVKGNTIVEPEYHLELKKEPAKDTVYNKTICEELKNKYSCKYMLTVKCNSVIAAPVVMNVTGTNLPVLANTPGYARFGSSNAHWLDGGRGSVYDYYVNFNVVDINNVATFQVGNINYDDWVLIKLNGQQIWAGPRGGNKLELRGGRVEIDDSKVRGWKGLVNSSYSPENGTWYSSSLNIEIKQYLKAGNNTLSIRLVVGGNGGLLFDLRLAERACSNWVETWDEQCTRD